MELPRDQPQAEHRVLGFWDTVSIIIGIVIGATIFRSPPLIFSNVSSPAVGLGVWALGGVLSLIGAMCYAELASTYPRTGGDYVYLTRAFGPWMGFLFGWAQMTVILTGSIGVMAFVFADYAMEIWPRLDSRWGPGFAAGSVIVLTFTNMLGVVAGKVVQNILTGIKVLGLGAIMAAGFAYGDPQALSGPSLTQTYPVAEGGFGLAMILVLYAYGGWNDAAFVAAEQRGRRTIILALILGTAAITLIYMAVNVAYIMALGFDSARNSSIAVAADVLKKTPWGAKGAQAISVLVMVSALGAINGLTLTGARVYAALGADWKLFSWLARWSPRQTPVVALVVQALISLAMIGGVGTEYGRNLIDTWLVKAGLNRLPWQQYFGGFNTLVAGTAPVFWGFFLLTGLSLFVLRELDPDVIRPFKVPLFPLLPLTFCGTCFFMLYRAIDYAGNLCLLGAIPLLLGLPFYYLSGRRREATTAPPA